MIDIPFDDLRALDDFVMISAGSKKFPVLKFGFELQLSWDESWTKPRRMAALDVAEKYWRDTAKFTNVFLRHDRSKPQLIRDGVFIPMYRDWWQNPPDHTNKFIILFDRNDRHPPSLHKFMLWIGSPKKNLRYPYHRRGNLSASWAASRLLDDAVGMIRQVLDWCNQLHPEQGAAGLTPIAEFGLLRNRCLELNPVLRRYPGMDFGIPHHEAPMNGGLRTINWLTIIGDHYVKALGGANALAERFGPQTINHGYDGGLLLQAGPLPDCGDLDVGQWPAAYLSVWRALRSQIFTEIENTPMALIKWPEGDRHQQTLDWVTRFDAA